MPTNKERQEKIQNRIEELIGWLKSKGAQEPPRPQWDQNNDPEKIAANVAKDVIWLVGPGGFKQVADAHFGITSPVMAVLHRIIRLAYSDKRIVVLVDQVWNESRHYTSGGLRETEEHLDNVEKYKNDIETISDG